MLLPPLTAMLNPMLFPSFEADFFLFLSSANLTRICDISQDSGFAEPNEILRSVISASLLAANFFEILFQGRKSLGAYFGLMTHKVFAFGWSEPAQSEMMPTFHG